MLYYTGYILDPVLNTVAAWLVDAEVCEEGRRYLLRCLNEGYCGWRWIVGKVELGLDAALQALRAVKEEVVSFCREYRGLIKELTKHAVNISAREMIGKFVVKTITREGGKQVAKVATKSAIKTAANPVGIVSDITQTGLEAVGYKKLGRTVGIGGNIASGAMVGGAVGGPAGAAVGALLGFGVWGVGQVTGKLVDRAFGE